MSRELIQAKCLEEMRGGGLTPEQRLACYERFKETKPDTQAIEHFFDAWGKDYDKDMMSMEYTNHVRVAELMGELFHEGKKRRAAKVLDVAAGTGLCGLALHGLGFAHIDALDGSVMSLQVAKKRNVYQHIYPEVMVKGEPLKSVPGQTYDAIVASGSFYPGNLTGEYITCFIGCLKKGGKLVLTASPHRDEGVGLRPILKKLEEDGVVEVKREEYLPACLGNEDGTLWEMEMVHGCLKIPEE